MSNMMKFGNGLQRKYVGGVSSDLLTNAEKSKQQKDREALKAHSKNRAKAREERAKLREAKMMNPAEALEKVEMGEDAILNKNIETVQKHAKSKTNVLARKYGLPQPNNPEALKHDRFHCATCDRRLDNPNAHKHAGLDDLFADEDVRLMCCWCFGKFSDDDIKSTMYTGLEADAKVRLAVYNPEESTKEEVESLTSDRKMYLKSKLKRWEQDTALVGKVKHDYLLEVDQLENSVLYNAKTRYNACTW